ncbi:acetoin utilization protein [Paramagnetospirillum marisnigri]|uniref:Acetoin utilization protein n=1 Tax=Paramagnetospirillum marisnigri TaxID=1285242 RepID=A0A178MA26_9PROT|nr:histone deacetylase family protein [Paramagnetospirillum marisnigri]OAN45620.1 acetoin utilization protein [Paramagnetospirillum marisnigri]
MSSTVIYSHPVCLEHDTGEFHPECADRLRAIAHIFDREEFMYVPREEAPPASVEQILRAHTQAHYDRVMAAIPDEGSVELDGDTMVSPKSGEAALRSAGAACAAVDEVATGRSRNAFCATRPPGHHAEREAVMGFCLFSNAAIAALHARDAHGYKRVAVVDFDVHHGNGTQDCLWAQPGTFYASSHQEDAFPYTGKAEETGPEGGCVVVNVPLPAGTASDVFRAAYTETILPRLDAFAPDFLIISAGFDAHAADPMAHLRLQVGDFDWLTRELLKIARTHAGRRVVSLLEGGYETRALAACVAAHVRVLMEG